MQKLTPQIPLNGFGNVDYREFLKKYSGMERPQTSASDARTVSSIGINVLEGTEEHPNGSNLETIPEQAENMEDLEPSMKFPDSRNHPEDKLSSSERRPATSFSMHLPPISPALSERSLTRQGMQDIPERPQSQMGTVQRIEQRLLSMAKPNLKRLHQMCRTRDVNNTGAVPSKDFFGKFFILMQFIEAHL